jgi:2-oxo-3-hexenedioate decarboxylase
MEKENLEYWAGVLNGARIQSKPILQISRELASFSRTDAYSVQELQWELRKTAGENQVGWKMGLTSEAKRKQMNLDSPLYGFLSDAMQISTGGTFSLKGSIHPKIEPEVAFLIKDDLEGTVSREQVLNACSGVASALEILDSRYEEFRYFSMEDVIADNSSSSFFVVGPWEKNFKNLNLLNLKMEMSINGQLSQTGISKDISGDPVVSVIQLCQLLAERNQILKAGSIVLAGAATMAEMLKADSKVELKVDSLPAVSVRIEG